MGGNKNGTVIKCRQRFYQIADFMNAGRVKAVDGETALCGGGQPKQHFHGGGFTGAVGTEKTIDAALSVGYLKGYPTYVGNNENGIVVLGFSKDSFWKHMRASWDYSLIRDLPYIFLKILLINLVLILAIYMLVNGKLLKSVQPMIKGIQNLSAGEPVHIPETGVLSEICTNINRASDILQKQQEQLRKKERARANWIAGVSHDIRTPLSVVRGMPDSWKIHIIFQRMNVKKPLRL